MVFLTLPVMCLCVLVANVEAISSEPSTYKDVTGDIMHSKLKHTLRELFIKEVSHLTKNIIMKKLYDDNFEMLLNHQLSPKMVYDLTLKTKKNNFPDSTNVYNQYEHTTASVPVTSGLSDANLYDDDDSNAADLTGDELEAESIASYGPYTQFQFNSQPSEFDRSFSSIVDSDEAGISDQLDAPPPNIAHMDSLDIQNTPQVPFGIQPHIVPHFRAGFLPPPMVKVEAWFSWEDFPIFSDSIVVPPMADVVEVLDKAYASFVRKRSVSNYPYPSHYEIERVSGNCVILKDFVGVPVQNQLAWTITILGLRGEKLSESLCLPPADLYVLSGYTVELVYGPFTSIEDEKRNVNL